MDKKHVKVVIDRPLWTYHPKHKNIFYTLNYGYVEGVMWWDWEEQDVYVMWIDKPLETFEWDVIAIIHRAKNWMKNAIKWKNEKILSDVFCSRWYIVPLW